MKTPSLDINNGPIPGENFTSDTRNYPWHRPPDTVDIDEAIEIMAKKIMEPHAANGLLTMLEMGMTVATAVSTLVMGGVGAGKWTVDMALLIAGPTARMIEIMAKDAGIEFRMGTEDNREIITPPPEFYAEKRKNSKKYDLPTEKEQAEIVESVKSTGFSKPMEKMDV